MSVYLSFISSTRTPISLFALSGDLFTEASLKGPSGEGDEDILNGNVAFTLGYLENMELCAVLILKCTGTF